jgi:salicylate hydroxylase
MAVEDGAVIGHLLGSLCKAQSSAHDRMAIISELIAPVLKLYEGLRKSRTTTNVRGAVANRTFFHLPDGPEQASRDKVLADLDWKTARGEWKWVDLKYQRELLGHDAVDEASRAFEQWWSKVRSEKGRIVPVQA